MAPFTMVLDMANNAAAIPGSGNVPLVFTHTRDTAKFVVASLDLEKWNVGTYVMGDKMTFNEVLKVAENVKGKTTCLWTRGYHLGI
jgi:nucleoside-diphosphate-sugar epimerase